MEKQSQPLLCHHLLNYSFLPSTLFSTPYPGQPPHWPFPPCSFLCSPGRHLLSVPLQRLTQPPPVSSPLQPSLANSFMPMTSLLFPIWQRCLPLATNLSLPLPPSEPNSPADSTNRPSTVSLSLGQPPSLLFSSPA